MKNILHIYLLKIKGNKNYKNVNKINTRNLYAENEHTSELFVKMTNIFTSCTCINFINILIINVIVINFQYLFLSVFQFNF